MAMNVNVQFFSYFKQLTGTSAVMEVLPEGATVEDLLRVLSQRYPKLRGAERSMEDPTPAVPRIAKAGIRTGAVNPLPLHH